ncbi:MAG: hypothetical protein BWX86_02391 [Verrucomicrobia bacterium ADurb.Bin122]|nr:MAG: hypothetical protein BWX86_02391 [Verrucomicrobia bacterium ADurb.Bin122]
MGNASPEQTVYVHFEHTAYALAPPRDHHSGAVARLGEPACGGYGVQDRRAPTQFHLARSGNVPCHLHPDPPGRHKQDVAWSQRGVALDVAFKGQPVVGHLKAQGVLHPLPAVEPHPVEVCLGGRPSGHRHDFHKRHALGVGIHPRLRYLAHYRHLPACIGDEHHIPIGEDVTHISSSQRLVEVDRHRRPRLAGRDHKHRPSVGISSHTACGRNRVDHPRTRRQLVRARPGRPTDHTDANHPGSHSHHVARADPRVLGYLAREQHLPMPQRFSRARCERPILIDSHALQRRLRGSAAGCGNRVQQPRLTRELVSPGPGHLAQHQHLPLGFRYEDHIAVGHQHRRFGIGSSDGRLQVESQDLGLCRALRRPARHRNPRYVGVGSCAARRGHCVHKRCAGLNLKRARPCHRPDHIHRDHPARDHNHIARPDLGVVHRALREKRFSGSN